MEKKKEKIVSAVATMGIVLMLFGATYAYFASRVDAGKITDVEITANTVDVLTFETGDPITLSLDQENFASGKGNQSGSTFAKATLSANNKTNQASANYYVYLNVTNNTFEYTQEDSTPELLLQVTDPNGVEVTTLSGLEYKTVTDGKGTEIKGFDVTTLNGLVTIANNYEIVANNEIIHTWSVKLVFVNLDADQTDNAGHGLSATLKIQKDKEILTMANICKNGQTLDSCIEAMYSVDDTLYYHDSNLENGAGDNSYRYAGASEIVNNYICFGSEEEICPHESLYRIIGSFDEGVKLIKADYLHGDTVYSGTTDYYKGDASNLANIGAFTYPVSAANTFEATIESSWSAKIASEKIQMSLFINYSTNIADLYKEEMSSKVSTKYNVGAMYLSDYGYAAIPTYWTYQIYAVETKVDYRLVVNDNWMYMGLVELTFSQNPQENSLFYEIFYEGVMSGYKAEYSKVAYRPAFYLNSDVKYVSGNGTKNSPIIIE